MMARSLLITRTGQQTTQTLTAITNTTARTDRESMTMPTAIMAIATRAANVRTFKATDHGHGMTRRAIVAAVTLRAGGPALTGHRAGIGPRKERAKLRQNTRRLNKLNSL